VVVRFAHPMAYSHEIALSECSISTTSRADKFLIKLINPRTSLSGTRTAQEMEEADERSQEENP
jgi:hypothetical protein